MVAVPKAMQGKPRVVGLLVAKELEVSIVLSHPPRPFLGILAAARSRTRSALSRRCWVVSITRAHRRGHDVHLHEGPGPGHGRLAVEADKLDVARELLELGKGKIVLPLDHLVVQGLENSHTAKVVEGAIPDGWIGVDIGVLEDHRHYQNTCPVQKRSGQKTVHGNELSSVRGRRPLAEAMILGPGVPLGEPDQPFDSGGIPIERGGDQPGEGRRVNSPGSPSRRSSDPRLDHRPPPLVGRRRGSRPGPGPGPAPDVGSPAPARPAHRANAPRRAPGDIPSRASQPATSSAMSAVEYGASARSLRPASRASRARRPKPGREVPEQHAEAPDGPPRARSGRPGAPLPHCFVKEDRRPSTKTSGIDALSSTPTLDSTPEPMHYSPT